MIDEVNWASWADGTLKRETKQTWREREAQSRKIGSALFPFCHDLDLSEVRDMHKLLSKIVELDNNINIVEKASKSTDPTVIKAVERLNAQVKSQMSGLFEEDDYLTGNLLATRIAISNLENRLSGVVKALDYLITSFEVIE